MPKLHSKLALSTLHVEYVALSQSLWDLLSLKELITEIVNAIGLPNDIEYITHSTEFEDNQGAISLAKCPKITPRTKHIDTKYY